jgi:protein-tyrosine phosphatase
MAEAVFRKMVKEEGRSRHIFVDSAGTGDWHANEPPHAGTRRILDRHNISYEQIRARIIRSEDFERFDYIVCMDDRNLQDVRRLAAGRAHGRIFKLLDDVPEYNGADVPDPYYTGNFEEVYRMVDAGCRRLLERICRERDLCRVAAAGRQGGAD